MLLNDESSDEPQTVDTATVAAAVTAAGVVIVLVDAVVTAPPPPLDCVPVVAVATLFVRFPSDEMLVDDGNALALTAVVR